MKIRITLQKLALLSTLFFLNCANAMEKQTTPKLDHTTLEDRILGSIFGGCIGDALGKYTEFEANLETQFKKFPGGLKCYQDLKKHNLLDKTAVAPYTDDTAMSKVTLEVFIKGHNEKWDFNEIMHELAIAYHYDYYHNQEGWGEQDRAPGNTCKASVKKLDEAIKNKEHKKNTSWWKVGLSGKSKDGKELGIGCGSVMHAHIIGLLYADNPLRAGCVAALHSLITHGSPQAQAACAAMAVGTACAVQGKTLQFITKAMEKTARHYDPATAEKILHARTDANRNRLNYKELGNKLKYSKYIFDKYRGWDAGDAIAAATYIFALTPDNISHAWYLGVHTPGDSDSIASMAGALVGAYVGFKELTQAEPNWQNYENALHLKNLGEDAANVLANPGKSLKLSAHYPDYKAIPSTSFNRKDLLKNETPLKAESPYKKDDESHKKTSFTSSSYFRWGVPCLAIAAAAAVLYWWWK